MERCRRGCLRDEAGPAGSDRGRGAGTADREVEGEVEVEVEAELEANVKVKVEEQEELSTASTDSSGPARNPIGNLPEIGVICG